VEEGGRRKEEGEVISTLRKSTEDDGKNDEDLESSGNNEPRNHKEDLLYDYAEDHSSLRDEIDAYFSYAFKF
jgi:hypothetical protein